MIMTWKQFVLYGAMLLIVAVVVGLGLNFLFQDKIEQSEYDNFLTIVLVINSIFCLFIGFESILILIRIKVTLTTRFVLSFIVLFCIVFVTARFSFIATGDLFFRTIVGLLSGSFFFFVSLGFHQFRKKLEKQQSILITQKSVIVEQNELLQTVISSLTETTKTISSIKGMDQKIK